MRPARCWWRERDHRGDADRPGAGRMGASAVLPGPEPNHPGRGRDHHELRGDPLPVLGARGLQRAADPSLCRDPLLPRAAGPVRLRAAADPGRHLVAAARPATARRAPRGLPAHRPARPRRPEHLRPGRLRHRPERRDPRHGLLPRRRIHGLDAVLRHGLPQGDGAGVRGLRGLAALPRRLRAVPHRPRRLLVRALEALGHAAALRGEPRRPTRGRSSRR